MTTLIEMLKDLLLAFFEYLKLFLCWVLDVLTGIIVGVITFLGSFIPDLPEQNIAVFYNYYEVANTWIPLNWMILFLSTYIVLRMGIQIFTMAIRLIPMVG